MRDFKYVQRLYWQAYETQEKLDGIMDYFKKFKGSCDEIALLEVGYCMEDRFISLDVIKNRCARIKEAIAGLRSEGFNKIHINIMNTYGHSENVISPKYIPDFDTMEGYDGAKAKIIPCPNSERFLGYLKKKYELLAECDPDVMWIDDDVRLHHIVPVKYGCFCDICLGKFGRETGVSYTRDELIDELLPDRFPEENTIRQKWLLFNRETIGKTIRTATEAVHRVNKDIVMGLMTPDYEYNLYSAPDLNEYGKIMKNHNDEIKFRPGSGFWTDSIPLGAVYKGLHIGRIISSADPQAEFLSEVEGWPYQTLEKTPDFTAFEISAHIGIGGVTGITINLTECMGNDDREQSSYLEMLHNRRPFFKTLAESIQDHRHIGFYPYSHELQWAFNETKEDMANFSGGGSLDSQKLVELGIPISFDREENLGVLISGQAAKSLSAEMIVKISKNGIYTDGKSARIMAKICDDNIFGAEFADLPEYGVYEKYLAHPFNEGYNGYNRASATSLDKSNNTDAVMRLKGAIPLTEMYNYDDEALGLYGMTAYENGNGGRTVVTSYLPWEHIHFLHKRHQITQALDWISNGKMPVKINSPYKIAQSVWEREEDSVIVLFNISFQRAHEIELYVRYSGVVEELQADGNWIVKGSIKDNTYIVPDVDPWSVRVLKVRRSINE